jgi:hypothetical protein
LFLVTEITTEAATTKALVGIVPEHSRQESPGGMPPYVYVISGLASLAVLVLLLLLLLLLRRRHKKKLSHSVSSQQVVTAAFDNNMYGMTRPQGEPEGAVGHDYEELPEVIIKKKKGDEDFGDEAKPLPHKVPVEGATGGDDDYEVLPADKVKLEDELGKEFGGSEGNVNPGFYENLPEKHIYDVPKKF